MPVIRELRVLDLDYPPALRELEMPPDPLCIRGPLGEAPGVAIVGTRNASPSALNYAENLAFRLAKRGVVVWSGGARGIDEAAHRGALAADGRTVAVIGTGFDHCYPAEHAELYDRILAAGGALVSPFDRSQDARLYTFPKRNAVLAALTRATVVVQAPLRSGARSTAGFARRLARPLFVVPAAPWDAGFEGNLAELVLGARMLTDEAELWGGAAPIRPRRGRQAPAQGSELFPRPPPKFDSPHVEAVFRATCPTPRHFDDLCSETRLGAPLVQQALLTLTLQAVLVEDPAGWYRRSSR